MSPRLFGVPAARVPVVAVLRRGPSDWSHVGRWDVARGVYEPGAWIRSNLYPQRCDLSPDGRWLCYFTLRGKAAWRAGTTYVAISRLPWLTALAAWGTCGTWTRGAHFIDERGVSKLGPPSEGDVGPCLEKFGLVTTRAASFAVERRRGWTETVDTEPRKPGDTWDESRPVTMQKARPKTDGAVALAVHGWFAAFRSGVPGESLYAIVENGRERWLEGVQWADWDAEGRLLIATEDGRLQIRDGADAATVAWEHDLAGLTPAPAPPPEEARRW
ncbi:MAG: hypothetical protein DMD80_12200 [Candidatus Rokuibacteriota bacterium]|nr:MAG: hypothetical protein DMD80_12200 [Candidatus Rokubacteria bacterium]PYN26629.1 MAG: hypothetical protein DMD76_09470 [Candidatus Rokubacteria bacterium]